MARIDESVIRSMPKAEVHVHLEGTFELADLLELSRESDTNLPWPARRFFDHAVAGDDAGGLSGFLGYLDWQCSLIRTPDQAARHAYRFAARQTANGVVYSDVILNPTHWNSWRGRTPELIDAIAAGFDQAEQDGLCDVGLCLSLLRQQTAQEGVDLVSWIIADRPRRVVALSVDGDESAGHSEPSRFREAFELALDGGLHRTVHAGESSGPESIRAALDILHAERIDHGVRVVEDDSLVQRLADEGVPLGICPRSNVALGVVADWPSHPFGRLRRAGVAVTLNTDDPAPLGTTLVADWAVAADQFALGTDDLVDLASASIDASFASSDRKRDLHADLDGWVAARSVRLLG